MNSVSEGGLSRKVVCRLCAVLMILAPFCMLRVAGQQVEQRRVTSAREKIERRKEKVRQCELQVQGADSIYTASVQLVALAEDSLRILADYEKRLNQESFSVDKQARKQVRGADDETLDSLQVEYRHTEKALTSLYRNLDARFRSAQRLYERGKREQARAKQKQAKARRDLKDAHQGVKDAEKELTRAIKEAAKRQQQAEKRQKAKEERKAS